MLMVSNTHCMLLVVAAPFKSAGGLVTPVYDDKVFMNEMRTSQVREGGGGAWREPAGCFLSFIGSWHIWGDQQ